MFTYYLQLGLHSLKRNPVLTALMVIGIGLGIAASMTTLTVLHLTSSDAQGDTTNGTSPFVGNGERTPNDDRPPCSYGRAW